MGNGTGGRNEEVGSSPSSWVWRTTSGRVTGRRVGVCSGCGTGTGACRPGTDGTSISGSGCGRSTGVQGLGRVGHRRSGDPSPARSWGSGTADERPLSLCSRTRGRPSRARKSSRYPGRTRFRPATGLSRTSWWTRRPSFVTPLRDGPRPPPSPPPPAFAPRSPFPPARTAGVGRPSRRGCWSSCYASRWTPCSFGARSATCASRSIPDTSRFIPRSTPGTGRFTPDESTHPVVGPVRDGSWECLSLWVQVSDDSAPG